MKRLIAACILALGGLIGAAAPAFAQEDNDVVETNVLNETQVIGDIVDADFDDVFSTDSIFG